MEFLTEGKVNATLHRREYFLPQESPPWSSTRKSKTCSSATLLTNTTTVVKPQPDQMSQPRLAVVYFVNPDHEHMTKAIRFHQTLREEATIKCTKSPGAPVNGAACKPPKALPMFEKLVFMACLPPYTVDRLVSAISAVDNDEYRQVVDERAFNAAKSGSLVSTPPGLAVDYTSLAIRPVPEAVGKAKSLPIAKRAGVAA